jgi:hypothetical protein
MTYFADLSPCTYFSGKHPVLLAVGWLQHDREYPLGDPGQALYERLKEYQKGSWQPGIFLGGHRCDFCRYDGFYSHSNIVVPRRGVTYVAPEGIVHYVGCHRYLPPPEFCEAVLSSPPAGSQEYFERLHANGWSPKVARPRVIEPKWRRRFLVEAILTARGEGIAAAIDAYRELHGALPTEIESAVALVADEVWEYGLESEGFRLTAYSKIEGVKVSRAMGSPGWSCSYDSD